MPPNVDVRRGLAFESSTVSTAVESSSVYHDILGVEEVAGTPIAGVPLPIAMPIPSLLLWA